MNDMEHPQYWVQLHEAEEQMVHRHRAALLRVAKGSATYNDAVMLAAALNHPDLFANHVGENHATDIEDDPE